MKKVILVALIAVMAIVTTGCSRASVASRNISRSANQFQITRRIVFYNTFTGEWVLKIEGLCSLGDNDPPDELSVTCRTGEDEYKKHFLGKSGFLTYFAEQIEPSSVDTYNYLFIVSPETVIPDIEIDTSGQEE